MVKKIEQAIEEVRKMYEISDEVCDTYAAGFDEGYGVGKVTALEEVLVLLEKINKK